MAQITYNSISAVTAQTRSLAYTKLGMLMEHLDQGFGGAVDLVSVVINLDRTITVILTGPLPAAQLAHLGLQ